MMGRKQKLVDGSEYDLLFAKNRYCYLQNHNTGVKKIKRKMNKRFRRDLKLETDRIIKELICGL
jgi:hypothetical protein